MPYASGPLHLEVQSAQRSRRMVRASCAASAILTPICTASGSTAIAKARSIAAITLRHLLPLCGNAAPASVWNIQNTFRLYSTISNAPALNTAKVIHRALCSATQDGAKRELDAGFMPVGRVL
jgi:hypothetical protein